MSLMTMLFLRSITQLCFFHLWAALAQQRWLEDIWGCRLERNTTLLLHCMTSWVPDVRVKTSVSDKKNKTNPPPLWALDVLMPLQMINIAKNKQIKLRQATWVKVFGQYRLVSDCMCSACLNGSLTYLDLKMFIESLIRTTFCSLL